MTEAGSDAVAGQVHALKAVLMAFIRTHPDPETLLAELEYSQHQALARIEGQSFVSEAAIDGFRDAFRLVLAVAAEQRKRLVDRRATIPRPGHPEDGG